MHTPRQSADKQPSFYTLSENGASHRLLATWSFFVVSFKSYTRDIVQRLSVQMLFFFLLSHTNFYAAALLSTYKWNVVFFNLILEYMSTIGVYQVEFCLSVCETPERLRGSENVTGASADKAASGKWGKFQIWMKYPLISLLRKTTCRR